MFFLIKYLVRLWKRRKGAANSSSTVTKGQGS